MPAEAPAAAARNWPLWAGLFLLCLAAAALVPMLPWLAAYPADWTLPIADWINAALMPVFAWAQPVGRAFALALDAPLRALRAALEWLPWPALALMVAVLALRASGWALALFAVLAQVYVVGAGYWPQTMNTLAIVLMSLPPAVAAGFALGAVAHRWPRFEPPLVATLDVMQTFPAFAYLIPLLILFGFGPAPGLVASIVFSLPPMVRNTMLGLGRVQVEVIESAQMSGASPRQLFWRARVPSALPQLMIGVNQTTMASLSMVIIVAIIGGFNDIGWEVLSAMRGAELGRSLLSGLVIVVMAILLDRITLGLATLARRPPTPVSGRGLAAGLALAAVGGVALRLAFPGQTFLPAATGRVVARWLDRMLLDFVAATSSAFSAFHDALTYGVMLPLRIGFAGTASPVVWGFALAPWMVAVYALAAGGVAAMLWRKHRAAALILLFAALILATGLPRFPWPGLSAAVLLLAWTAGGYRLAGLAAAGLALILLSGMWPAFMQSAYLCGIAVVFCLAIGGALGVVAAENDRFSAILRPINDALQTMPQFVFLIPALMLFRVGEFTALIAIMLYAIVPPIRYVEHGLRNVPAELVEAARQMGATRSQILWQVKLPLARPVIRLGLNQTIMAAISMLVIAALVGTRDLGQQVYIALGKADLGLGLVAGMAISCIALVSDRMLRGAKL